MTDTEIFVLNDNFERFSTPIDVYESFQWKESYNGIGSFELVMPVKHSDIIVSGSYIESTADPNHCAVIEYYEKTTDDDGAEGLLVKGRFVESLLDRRVILSRQRRSANPANIIVSLLQENVTSPENLDRKMSQISVGTIYYPSQTVSSYSALRSDLLTEVQKLCQSCNMGFRLKLSGDFGSRSLVFDTYVGRTDQNPLILSRDRGNIQTLDYYKDKSNEVNVMYVEGADNVRVTVEPVSVAGINRKEAILDATNWSIGSDSESYPQTLQTKGELELEKLVVLESMTASIHPMSGLVYGVDYGLGDEAVLVDETLGVTSTKRILEITHVWDTKGYSVLPSLGSAKPTLFDKIKYISQNIL